VVAYVEQNTILSVLGSQRSTSLHHVLSDTPALGDSAADVLGGIRGTELANAWGNGGIRISGTGTGGADTGLPMLGGPGGLNTIPGGHGTGTGPHYGSNVGTLDFRRQPRVPQIISTQLNVRGNLDKEIIRRIVRTHLNEIRYCYEQSLVRHPSLSGRVVVQFTIANTGRVIASVLQSSTIPEPALNSCVVQATRRWQYPAPDGGGLAIVSYPFQLTPAGG
jgi:TonB family protein